MKKSIDHEAHLDRLIVAYPCEWEGVQPVETTWIQVVRHIERLRKERDELRKLRDRQYTRLGDPSGASAPLRAEALKVLLKYMRRLDQSWIIWDQEIAHANLDPAGDYLLGLLEEEKLKREPRPRSGS